MTIDYDRAAAGYARYRDVQSGVLRRLLDLDVLRTPARVLEVGCGTANHIRALRTATGCAAWGADPSVGMLQRAAAAIAPGTGAVDGAVDGSADGADGNADGAAASAPGGVALACARAEGLPYPDAAFDLVFSVDVAHHLGDLEAAFVEMARVLRPGGALVTATDSETTLRTRAVLSAYFPETVPHELARYPSVARLEAVHARAGLALCDAVVVAHPYVLDDARPFRERAYSCLHLISQTALETGVRRLEADLPLATVSRNYLMVARKTDVPDVPSPAIRTDL